MLKSSAFKWSMLGVLAYLVFTIFTAPAELLRAFTGDNVRIDNLQGSLWKGTASELQNGNLKATDFSWSFKPLALFQLKAGARIDTDIPGGRVQADILRGFGSSISAANVSAVLNLRSAAESFRFPVALDGEIALTLDKARWQETYLGNLEGEVILANLIERSSRTEVGTLQIVFSGADDNGDILGALSDTAAPYALDGTVKLSPDRSYVIDAVLTPKADTPQQLLQAVGLLGGGKDAQGNYTINLSGKY